MLPPRIRDRVNVDPATGCWLWTGAVSARRYGHVAYQGRMRGAHVVFYQDAKGPIPEGMVIDHLCRTTLCVNPDHLEAVPQSHNVRRGRTAKLNEMVVREIRELRKTTGESYRKIARRYGVNNMTIANICDRVTWADVD